MNETQCQPQSTQEQWTVAQTIQALAGRDAAMRGEPLVHHNGPHWSTGWMLYVLGQVGLADKHALN